MDEPREPGGYPYCSMTDEEFLGELRQHLHEKSWSLEHLEEIERRGGTFLDEDPQLEEAIERERRALKDSIRKALDPVLQGIFGKLSPLQQQLKQMTQSTAPKVDVAALLPQFDIPKMLSSSYALVDVDSVRIGMPDSGYPRAAAGSAPIVDAKVLDDVISETELRLEEEARSREAQLQIATAAVAQLKVMTRVLDAVTQPPARGWYDCILLVLTAIAAIGAVVGVAVALL